MRWAGLPAQQTGETPSATVSPAAFLAFFTRAEAGEWEGLLSEYTEYVRAHPDPARRHFARVGDWGRARTMRDHAGASWDEGNRTVLEGRLPPQYAHRNMMLGHAEKRELARHMLPDADEMSAFEVDHTIGPPAVDAWLHASWRRSRLVVGGTRCALSQILQSALPTPRRAR